MSTDITDYSYLTDPDEREWITNLDPTHVRDNAHRMYEWMDDAGVAQDSFLRELAFEKASRLLGIDYDTLYEAWLNTKPIVPGCAYGTTRDHASSCDDDAAPGSDYCTAHGIVMAALENLAEGAP